nr:MAG TPA: hypothetical protein [Caudoviricetes sp.]
MFYGNLSADCFYLIVILNIIAIFVCRIIV